MAALSTGSSCTPSSMPSVATLAWVAGGVGIALAADSGVIKMLGFGFAAYMLYSEYSCRGTAGVMTGNGECLWTTKPSCVISL